MKTGRNDPCPCKSGKKYEHCCLQKETHNRDANRVDDSHVIPVRARNLLFLNKIAEALQFDTLDRFPKSFEELLPLLKKAVTPEAVREIHLTIPKIWPNREDLSRCLTHESQEHSGLYIGSHFFHTIAHLLNRHALYDQNIVLFDPLSDPRILKPEFNPVDRPQEHITTTFHYVLLWFLLSPWIDAGIVKVIRDPGDFDLELMKECFRIEKQRSQCKELRDFAAKMKVPREFEQSVKDPVTLGYPDEYYIKKAKEDGIPTDKIIEELKRRRERSLYYVDAAQMPQLLKWSSGTNYEMGKYICERMKSHLITDSDYRWTEMEYDRRVNGVSIDPWTPFAKAFQSVGFKHLNGLVFDDLLKLRRDGYLDNMRSFLRRVWNSCSNPDQFDEGNINSLTAELVDQVSRAESEWKKIDSNLWKWFGTEGILGAIGVAVNPALWLPGVGVAVHGITTLAQASKDRRGFVSKYPAAFFIKSIRSVAKPPRKEKKD